MKSAIPAFYAKWVTGLRLRDVQVDWAASISDYFSNGVKIEDFNDVTIDGFSGRQAQAATGAAIDLQNGSGVSIVDSRAMPGTRTFLEMKVRDRRVFVNYDLSGADTAIAPRGDAQNYALSIYAVR